MTTEPSRDTDRQALVSTLLVAVISAVTVLGAVLLATQGQARRGQPVVRQTESASVDLIPTAAVATPPLINLIPRMPVANTIEPPHDASPTASAEPTQKPIEHSDEQVATPSPSPEIPATPTLLKTVAPAPTATPWPCAGGAPIHWQLYIVQRGDTLFSLARRHGTSMYWVIYYNCLQSDQVRTGQRLYLPPLPTPVVPSMPTLTPLPTPTPTQDNPPPPPPPPQPSSTAVPTLTAPPTALRTATATVTARPSLPPTATLTPRPTATANPTPIETSTPTSEPTVPATTAPTAIPTNTPPPSPVPTDTPNPSPTP